MLYLNDWTARSHTFNDSFILPLPSDRKTDEGRKATYLVKDFVLNSAVLINTINSFVEWIKWVGALDDWKQGQSNDKVAIITLRFLLFPGINYTLRWVAKRDRILREWMDLKLLEKMFKKVQI